MRAHVIMIALVCLATQGCASTESVVPLTELKSVKASPPADTVKPCEAPVLIPSGDAAIMNGTYQVMNGGEIDLGNTKIGDITFKLRRYANSSQNTVFTTTPT